MTQVHVIPHTHWDREWYEPFQRFRLRLLGTVEQVLEMLEDDEGFVFTFDGQTAAIEDYLELRPEQEQRIRGHVESGRLLIGPWRILSDEFLTSGETLVRNLEAGWAVADRLGGAMEVGYLPDMFGHVAQMPQILRRAGLRDAVVWRGVPHAVDRHAFTWVAPDGSEVRAEYLLGGYGHAAYLFTDEGRLDEDVRRFRARMAAFADDAHLLMLYGADHTAPRRDLMSRLRKADAALDELDVGASTIPAYLESVRGRTGLPRWHGELRSGARANVLMGVTSTRVDVKAAAGRAALGLERYAEPLAALHGARWPDRELALGWARMVENSAHDSICACSHDETVAQVALRYAEAAQLAAGLAAEALAPAAVHAPRAGAVVCNPSPWPRTDEVVLDLERPGALACGDGSVVATQEVRRHPEVLIDREGSAGEALSVFGLRHGRELFGRWLAGYEVDAGATPPCLTIKVDGGAVVDDVDVDGLVAAATREVVGVGADRWRVVLRSGPRTTVRARVPVPALGWTTVAPSTAQPSAMPSTAQPTAAQPTTPSNAPARRGNASLDNGLVRVDVAADGTLNLEGDGVRLEGAGRLVDGGDAGDTYNHGPPEGDVFVDEPDDVVIEPTADGPLAAGLRITRRYAWPVGLTADRKARSAESVPVDIVTDVELRADERFVRVEVRFDNPARDHRLRWHVPLPAPVRRSFAEGHFAVVERGLEAEGGHGEEPLPTFPAHAFAAVDGVAVLLPHVAEYEVTDSGRELALTLLRATAYISVDDNANRADPAGPELPVPANQMVGPCRFAFALRPVADASATAALLADAEHYRLPFATRPGTAEDGGVARTAEGLRLDGDGVVLSSVRDRDGACEVRLVAMSDSPRRARLTGRFDAAGEADLRGRPGRPVSVTGGSLELALRPWEIRTLQLVRARVGDR